MRRFWGMVVNEHIKIMLKTSTIIMLILVAVSSIGLNTIIWSSSTITSEYTYNYEEQSYKEDYDEQIKFYKKEVAPGFELRVEMYQYLKQNSIYHPDWRYAALFTIYEEKIALLSAGDNQNTAVQAIIDETQKAITSNNFSKYIDINIATVKADATLSERMKNANVYALEYKKSHNLTTNDAWQINELSEYITSQESLVKFDKKAAETAKEKQAFEEATEASALVKYRLDNNIDTYITDSQGVINYSDTANIWELLGYSSQLVAFIGILIIIIAGSSIAGEFSQGTIKFLLINPIKRWKIITAKYISILSFSVIMLALFFLVNLISGGLFTGFSGFSTPYLVVSGDSIHRLSGFVYILKQYGSGALNIIVIATMAFMISSLAKSSTLSIALGVGSLLVGTTISALLGALGQDWARYLIFSNLDLASIANGETLLLFYNHTVSFAVCIIIIYMIVFLLTAYDAFTRRDIK